MISLYLCRTDKCNVADHANLADLHHANNLLEFCIQVSNEQQIGTCLKYIAIWMSKILCGEKKDIKY